MKPLSAICLCLVCLSAIAAAKTKVTIRGAESKSESELLFLIGGRLTHVENDPASASRADDAAFLLTQVMRKDGYADVRVTPSVVGPEEILLTIDEGGRRSLGKVEVRGVTGVEAGRLERVYSSPASKDRPIGSGSAPFREGDVEIGLAMMKQDLNALGYWSAEAKVTSRETDDKGNVNLVIDVEQGPLFKIGTPKITSTNGDGSGTIREKSGPYVGKDATTTNISAMRKEVTEAFTGSGYAMAKLTMGRSLVGANFVPEFNLDLGKRVRLREIEVTGLEKTNPNRIKRRLEKLEGEWYDEAAMNKRVSELLGTGAFTSITQDTDEVGEDEIDFTLNMREGRAKEVTLGAGFGSYEGAIFRAGYADRNLWGQMLSFSSGFEFSSRGVLGETKIVNPWLFGSDYSMATRIYALIYGHEGYSSFETGLDTKFSRKFGDHYLTELLFGYSIINITAEGLDKSELGETVYTHPRIALTQTIDFRDNPVLPKNGWHIKMPLQVGAVIGDMSTTYVKGGISGGWYHPLGKIYQLGLGGSMNFIIPSGDSTELPIDLRLFNGGARSVRSFPERELGPLSADGDYPLGGEASWVVNAEVSRPVAGPLSAVAFMDAGALGREFSELASAEIEVALGLGVRLDLPIGPVRLEYGYNMTRDKDEPIGAFHFAIGVAF
ncbi:BamA/TamA family outer membrane protein [Luteolibacter sp. SL250]|uniref:BamA/OMP85 family outer membrane protein n=1 Tax=Luteolibacter sp. SL250 TaxID=2995170 RepID=UPI002270BB5D|nr:BamA/TamA family outer membrane protein [Luteolibacter sp. SL250]WAC18710.1 BamA/TamA family outer membrane protein [Luteolibacter sp. SL250]